MYVERLIGPHTVSTLTAETIMAFADHGNVADTIEQGIAEAKRAMDGLAKLGIDFSQVAAQLEGEGVQKFNASFDLSLAAIQEQMDVHAHASG